MAAARSAGLIANPQFCGRKKKAAS